MWTCAKRRSTIFFILWIIGIILCCSAFRRTYSSNSAGSDNYAIYKSDDLRVQLTYDKKWLPAKFQQSYSPLIIARYEGNNGFFEIGTRAEVSDVSNFGKDSLVDQIDAVAKEEVKRGMSGLSPSIEATKVDGQSARFIIPRTKQSLTAELVIQFPKEIAVMNDSEPTDYLVLEADKEHIKQIANTIRFNKPLNHQAVLINKPYHVCLNYDSSWDLSPIPHLVSPGFKVGKDGFFNFESMTTESIEDHNIHYANSIGELAQFNIKAEGFGSSPMVIGLKIQGQPARLIIPSMDQQSKWFGFQHAQLLVKYPADCVIYGGDYTFDYFVLDADIKHILKIARTIRFIN